MTKPVLSFAVIKVSAKNNYLEKYSIIPLKYKAEKNYCSLNLVSL